MSGLRFPKPTPTFTPHGRVPAESATDRAKLKREASRLVSLIVRRRDGGCRLKNLVPDIPCWGPLDAAHIWAKQPKPAIRFEPAALIAACRQHHQWGGAHEDAWLALCRELLGPALFEHLRIRSHRTVKLDLKATVAALQRRVA